LGKGENLRYHHSAISLYHQSERPEDYETSAGKQLCSHLAIIMPDDRENILSAV
jgi:hypothetical protein